MSTYIFKRGNTFELSGLIHVVHNGARVMDMTGWQARVCVRNAVGKHISEPAFFWLDPANRLVKIREESSATALWPVGILYIDIRFTAPNGDIISTSTATIEVVKEIANA
jgi:hypothetical protein